VVAVAKQRRTKRKVRDDHVALEVQRSLRRSSAFRKVTSFGEENGVEVMELAVLTVLVEGGGARSSCLGESAGVRERANFLRSFLRCRLR
jgi:hypothetical protein